MVVPPSAWLSLLQARFSSRSGRWFAWGEHSQDRGPAPTPDFSAFFSVLCSRATAPRRSFVVTEASPRRDVVTRRGSSASAARGRRSGSRPSSTQRQLVLGVPRPRRRDDGT